MANVNCYPNPPVKPDQPVNSQYIQKILDENVGLIHAIIEKQQQNQEAEDLLKSLHKNLIYLATIADQTTSAGNTSNSAPPTQPQQYIYPQPNATHPGQPNQNFHANNSQPMQTTPYVTQPSMMISQSGVIESSEKKQPLIEETHYKEPILKPEANPAINVDMDREVDKCHTIRDCHQQLVGHKPVDMNKECPVSQNTEGSKDLVPSQSMSSTEYMQKYEDNIATTTSSHMQISTIKTDMPPPSQPIGGIHQEKSPMQPTYPANQRIMYPGVTPNYNQYNPHLEQNSKFYPQNVYQQSPYNYQGMYNPYQPVAAPPASPNHYNQHMMNSPMYPQYPYYQQQQQPGMEQMPPGPKDPSLPPQQMHPGSTMSQPMYPPNTMGQSAMYSSQNPMSHPPISMPQPNKPLPNMGEPGSAPNMQNVSE